MIHHIQCPESSRSKSPVPTTHFEANLVSRLPAVPFLPTSSIFHSPSLHHGRPNNKSPAAAHNTGVRGARDTIFLLLFQHYFVPEPEYNVSQQPSRAGGRCGEGTTDVSASFAAEYHVGSSAKWGERRGYYGEDIEWEGLGSGESCRLSFALRN
jgi:hypothetical protein